MPCTGATPAPRPDPPPSPGARSGEGHGAPMGPSSSAAWYRCACPGLPDVGMARLASEFRTSAAVAGCACCMPSAAASHARAGGIAPAGFTDPARHRVRVWGARMVVAWSSSCIPCGVMQTANSLTVLVCNSSMRVHLTQPPRRSCAGGFALSALEPAPDITLPMIQKASGCAAHACDPTRKERGSHAEVLCGSRAAVDMKACKDSQGAAGAGRPALYGTHTPPKPAHHYY